MSELQPTDRILTIPNLVSFARLVGVGFFWWLILNDHILVAAWFIVAVGFTDWVDGYLARRLNQVSRLGKALDPVADRLMVFSAVVGGLIVEIIPLAIGIPLLAREALMTVVTLVLFSRGHGVLEVRYAGKLATAILYAAIPGFYFAAADVLAWFTLPAAWALAVVGLAIYWYVTFLYMGDAASVMRRVESSRPRQES